MPNNANEEQLVWDYIQNNGGSGWFLIDGVALDENNPLHYTQSNGQEFTYTNWIGDRPKYENSFITALKTNGFSASALMPLPILISIGTTAIFIG